MTQHLPDHPVDDGKTLFGHLPSLDAVFLRLRVCEYVITERRGSYAKSPVGFFYLGGLPGSISHRPATVLYAQPSQEVLDAVLPRCCNNALGSFEVIRSMYWKERGRMLIVARDAHHISAPWVCTVPYLTDAECEAWISTPSSDF